MSLRPIVTIELDSHRTRIKTFKDCTLFITSTSLTIFTPIKRTTLVKADDPTVYLYDHEHAAILVVEIGNSSRPVLLVLVISLMNEPMLESLLRLWQYENLIKDSTTSQVYRIPDLIDYLSSLEFRLNSEGTAKDVSCCMDWLDSGAESIFVKRSRGFLCNSRGTLTMRKKKSVQSTNTSSEYAPLISTSSSSRSLHVQDIFQQQRI